MDKPAVYLSNRLDTLLACLREQLFDRPPTSHLIRPLVLLPSLSVKQSLMMQLLQQGEEEIVLGVEFEEYRQGLWSRLAQGSGQFSRRPASAPLTLDIEACLSQVCDSDDTPIDSTSSDTQIQTVAQQLASLFLDATEEDPHHPLRAPETTKWVQQIWKTLLTRWTIPLDLIKVDCPDRIPPIHLFCIPHIPIIYHRILEKIAYKTSVRYYHLSPCATFWSDVATAQEQLFLHHQSPSTQITTELEHYLNAHHPLLVTCATINRSMMRHFETHDFELHELFEPLPHPSATLLTQLQASLLSGEAPSIESTISPDRSISLLPAHSRLEEVERLYHELEQLATQGSEISPAQIQVYAPKIEDYAPYIELIFGADHSRFPFTLYDLPRFQSSSLIRLLFDLFDLQSNRFSPISVLNVLRNPCFAQFSLQETDIIERWTQQLKICWGVNRQHQIDLLKQDPDGIARDPLDAADSWENGLERLILSSLTSPREGDVPTSLDLGARLVLQPSQFELLGKTLQTLHHLKDRLTTFEQTKQTLSCWAQSLRELSDQFLVATDEEQAAAQRLYQLFQELGSLSRACPHKHPYPFSSIKLFLKTSLESSRGSGGRRGLDTIAFRALKLGGAIAAQVTVLLGCDEESFPRHSTDHPFIDLHNPTPTTKPTIAEQDRALFLDLLTTTERRIIFSYLERSPTDMNQQGPSRLIIELADLLNLEVTDLIPQHLPPSPSHPQAFLDKTISSQIRPYLKAQSYLTQSTTPSSFLFPEFNLPQQHPFPTSLVNLDPITITISSITASITHSLRFYFQKGLGVHLSLPNEWEERFNCSPRQRALFEQALPFVPLQQLMEQAAHTGNLPLPPFHLPLLPKEPLSPKRRKRLILARGYTTSCQTDPHSFCMPAPTVSITCADGQKPITIEGTIDHISDEGLLCPKRKSLAHLIALFPSLLLLAYLDHPFPKQILFPSSKQIDLTLLGPVLPSLEALLRYHLLALAYPIPFYPDWASAFLQQDSQALEKVIETTLDRRSCPYLRRALATFEPSLIVSHYSPIIIETFHLLQEQV